jgi:hypothetical protein
MPINVGGGTAGECRCLTLAARRSKIDTSGWVLLPIRKRLIVERKLDV